MAADRRGIVVFGGTFDPPHLGHLILASDAAEALRPERFLVVPCGDPWHRSSAQTTAPSIRWEMTQAAFSSFPQFEVTDREIQRPGPTYTVDTLRELRSETSAELTLLIGEDSLAAFDSWREPEAIAKLARIAVLERGEVRTDPTPKIGDDGLERITIRRIDISSTEIRARVAAGRPVAPLLPDGVAEIIEREGLYEGIRPGSRG